MTQRITSDQVVDSIFEPTIKELEEVLALSKKVKSEWKEFGNKSIANINPDSVENLNKIETAAKKVNTAFEATIKLDNDIIKLERKLEIAQSKKGKALALENEKLKEQNKLNRESAKNKLDLITLNNKEAGTLEKLTARNRILRFERKKLNLETQKGKTRLKEINRQLDINNAKIEKNSDKLKKQRIGVGRYGKVLRGLKGVLAAIGVTFGIGALVSAFRDLNALASEVKGVEFAFKRLGIEGDNAFKAVKKSTKGLISNLDIKKSLIEFDNFNINLKDAGNLMEFVAVRAAQTGRSVEFLTNSLNEGLSKGSLRRLDNLGVSMIAMRKEMKRTGASVVEAFTAIAGKEVQRAGAILDEAANSQQRWNASLENTKVAISSITQSGFAIFLKDAASDTLELLFPTKQLSDEYANQQIELNLLVNQITDVNIAEDDRLVLINKLNEEYPAFLENLSEEESTNENLAIRLIEVNDLYIKRIVLQVQQEKITKALRKAGAAATEVVKNSVKAERFAIKSNQDLGLGLDLTNKSFEQRIKLVKEALEINAKYTESTDVLGGTITLAQNKEAKALDKLNNLFVLRSVFLIDSSKKTKELTEEQKELNEIEIILGTTLEKINKLLEGPKRTPSKDRKKETKDEEKSRLKAEKARLKAIQDRIKEQARVDEVSKKNFLKQIDTEKKEREKADQDRIREQKRVDEISKKNFLKGIEEQKKLDKKEADRKKKLQDQRNKDTIASIEKIEQDAFDKRIRLIDDEINANRRRVDTLKLLAAQGNKDASESIAVAEKRQKELELERERRFKRQKTIEAVTSGLEVYRSKVAAGDDNAAANTLLEVGTLLTGLTALSGFKKGTENTGTTGALRDKDGVVTGYTHINERVLTEEDNAPLSGLSNETLSMVGSLYKKGLLEPVKDEVGSGMVMTFNIGELVKETQGLRQDVKNLPSQMPVSKTDYDTIAGIIIDKVTRGSTTKITKRKNR